MLIDDEDEDEEDEDEKEEKPSKKKKYSDADKICDAICEIADALVDAKKKASSALAVIPPAPVVNVDVQTQKRCSWRFTMERDKFTGKLVAIVASPQDS